MSRPVSNTDIREILRGVARAARERGDEQTRLSAGRSARLIVGRSWSRHVRQSEIESRDAH